LEHKKKDGLFLIGLEKLQTVVSCPSSFSLSLPATWVGSVDGCKVDLVSFSSVGAVMDLLFLALDQGLAKVS